MKCSEESLSLLGFQVPQFLSGLFSQWLRRSCTGITWETLTEPIELKPGIPRIRTPLLKHYVSNLKLRTTAPMPQKQSQERSRIRTLRSKPPLHRC